MYPKAVPIVLCDELYSFAHHARDAQQFGQGLIENFFEISLGDSFYGLQSVLYKDCHVR